VSERKGILLRLDPAVHTALARWAAEERRSTNAQIEFLLRRALQAAGPDVKPSGGRASRYAHDCLPVRRPPGRTRRAWWSLHN
jgi:hypothetical protein